MAKDKKLNIVLGVDLKEFSKGMNKASRELKRSSKQFAKIGIAVAALSAPMAAFANQASNTAKIFEAEMSKVAAISGATANEFERLTSLSQDLGRTTVFTASQVGQLQTEFSKLGFSTTEIEGATEATLSLAQAAGSSLAESAMVAGSTLRAFEIDAKNTQRVTDVMAASFTSSALDLELFKDSMKYVAPIAQSATISLERASAMLAALADSGIKGSQAGTSLRRIISEMALSGKSLEELASSGLSVTDAFDEVGRTAQSALLVLSKKIDKVNGLTTSLENSEGAAQAMADMMNDNFLGSTKAMSSAIEAVNISFGQIINDALRPTIDMLSSVIRWFAELDQGIKKIILALGAALSAFAAITTAIAGAQYAFGLLAGAFAAVNGPIIAIGVAVAALTAGLVLLNKESESNVKLYQDQKEAAQANINVVRGLYGEYDTLKSKTELSKQEQERLKAVTNKLIEIVPKAATKFNEFGEAIDIDQTIVDKYVTLQKSLNDTVKNAAITELKGQITQVKDELTNTEKVLEGFTKTYNEGIEDKNSDGYVQESAKWVLKYAEKVEGLKSKLSELQAQLKEIEGEELVVTPTLDSKTVETEVEETVKYLKGSVGTIKLQATVDVAKVKTPEIENIEIAPTLSDDQILAGIQRQIAHQEGLKAALGESDTAWQAQNSVIKDWITTLYNSGLASDELMNKLREMIIVQHESKAASQAMKEGLSPISEAISMMLPFIDGMTSKVLSMVNSILTTLPRLIALFEKMGVLSKATAAIEKQSSKAKLAASATAGTAKAVEMAAFLPFPANIAAMATAAAAASSIFAGIGAVGSIAGGGVASVSAGVSPSALPTNMMSASSNEEIVLRLRGQDMVAFMKKTDLKNMI